MILGLFKDDFGDCVVSEIAKFLNFASMKARLSLAFRSWAKLHWKSAEATTLFSLARRHFALSIKLWL